MTPQEHGLMIGMFAKQLQIMETLTTILKSRGILEDDDMKAFQALTESQNAVTQDVLARARLNYHAFAKTLGIETGLEQP